MSKSRYLIGAMPYQLRAQPSRRHRLIERQSAAEGSQTRRTATTTCVAGPALRAPVVERSQ